MQKQNVTRLGTLLVLALAIGACTNQKPAQQPDELKIVYRQASAEDLALAGEQLVTPSSFPLADRVLDEALAKDPSNKRAQFYKMFLKPFMVFQGVAVRVRPFVRAYGDMEQFKKLEDLPNSTTRDLLFNGREDIANLAQLQDLLVEYRDANIEFYQWLKNNEDLELVLNLNPWIFGNEIQKDVDCRLIEESPEGMRVVCDNRNLLQRKLSPADNIALRQGVASLALYAILYTSYTLDGLEKIFAQSKGQELSSHERLQILQNTPQAGQLRRDNAMKYIHAFGSDFAYAMSYAIKNQQALCPKTSDKARKGQVFKHGLCVASDTDKSLALLNLALKGAFVQDFEDSTGQKKSILIDPFAISTRPATDIRIYLPESLDACGHAASYADNTLGGIFPLGDVMRTAVPCDKQ